jgi:hypothetical protein
MQESRKSVAIQLWGEALALRRSNMCLLFNQTFFDA